MTKALLHNTVCEISPILVMGDGNSLVYNYLQKHSKNQIHNEKKRI